MAYEQMPLLCAELVQYHRASAILWLVVAVIGLILCQRWATSINRRIALGTTSSDDPELVGVFLFALAFVVVALINIHLLMKAAIAPRVLLLEELGKHIIK